MCLLFSLSTLNTDIIYFSYGEIGYFQISKAVEDYFNQRKDGINPASYVPLTFEELIKEVLIPESQVLLICQDLHEDPTEARNTLYESTDFGRLFLSDHLDRGRATLTDSTPSETTPPGFSSALPASEPFPPMSPLSNFAALPLPPTYVKPEPTEGDIPPDPNKLCPFCDELLPTSPSQELTALRTEMEKISVANPLLENLGHRTPNSIGQVQGYCERHRVESNLFPLAIEEKWPRDPDFSILFNRVRALNNYLNDLWEELENSSFYRAAKAHYENRGMSMSQMMSITQQYLSADRRPELGAA